MLNAKVNGVTLLKYPYTFADLREENPFTRYDGRFTLPEWYAQTEDAQNTGATVVEVVIADHPEYDSTSHYIRNAGSPNLSGNVWTLGWEIVERGEVPEQTATANTANYSTPNG